MMKKSEISATGTLQSIVDSIPARNKEDLIIGKHPHLFNPEHTRYGGVPVIPEHILSIKDDKTRIGEIEKILDDMAAEPLTDDEKRQSDEWQKLIMGPDPLKLMDDDLADSIIAWAEGRTEFPVK